ncbi:DMT family transporter [Chitinibacter tainanensis]|uniref:DMT family transporter n=1 Tax=Chitinibacter tainanensis TaxID=230667 RepID=UPI00235503C8|nr:DMT family transporter [Chitinibacter tainanensis]
MSLIERCKQSGPFWMVLAGLSFAIMGVFVKLGSAQFSTAELVFYRCAAGLLGIAAVVLPQGQTLKVAGPQLRLHLTRSISGFLALMLYFYAIGHLPLATAVTLNYTSPIFFVLVLSLHRRAWPQWQQAASVGLGFLGVTLLLQPTLNSRAWLAGLMGLGSGMLASIAYLGVSELGKSGEPEWRTVFYFSLVSTVGAGAWMLLQSQPLHLPNWHEAGILLAMGIAATLAQLAMTRAYRKGRSLVVVSLAYLTVVFSTLFTWLWWGEAGNGLSLLGMLIIVLAGIWAGATRLQRQ